MARLELTRSPDDRRVYVLPGVGELRTRRWPSSDVEAVAGGRTYTFAYRGRRRVPTATEALGGEAGRQEDVGVIAWGASRWNLVPGDDMSYYTLVRPGDEREVANLGVASWGRRSVPVFLDERAGLDPGLVLFAMFVMRRLADAINRPPGAASSPAG